MILGWSYTIWRLAGLFHNNTTVRLLFSPDACYGTSLTYLDFHELSLWKFLSHRTWFLCFFLFIIGFIRLVLVPGRQTLKICNRFCLHSWLWRKIFACFTTIYACYSYPTQWKQQHLVWNHNFIQYLPFHCLWVSKSEFSSHLKVYKINITYNLEHIGRVWRTTILSYEPIYVINWSIYWV